MPVTGPIVSFAVIAAVLESATGERFDRLMARLVLTAAERDAVTAAVAAAEAGSDGEIVTIVAARSDAYHDVALHYAVLALLAITTGTLWEKRFGVSVHPVLANTDGRLYQQTNTGVQLVSKDLSDFTFTGGDIFKTKIRNETGDQGMITAGGTQQSDRFLFGGADYTGIQNTTPVA